jgi:hypothetical protein
MVIKMKNMGDVLFRGCNATGVFADQYVLNPLRKLKFPFFNNTLIFDNIHRDIGIDKAE